MQLKKGDIVEVEIEKLAFGGDGIGKCHIPEELANREPSTRVAEGLVTFVPNVIPGDRVKVSLRKIKSNRLEGQLHELVEPSPKRVEPRCKHFNECGGCVWQNLSYENQLVYKEQQIRETLQHLGGFSEGEVTRVVRPILGCAEPWNYRNKMELSFARSADGEVMLGLHKPKMRHEVFDMEECFLQSELVAELAQEVLAFAREEGLNVFDDRTQDGLLRNLVIREGKNTGEVMVNLVTSINSFPQSLKFKEQFSGGKWSERITSLLWTTVMQIPGTPTWTESQILAGKEVIHEELRLETGRVLRFEISRDAFFQPNTKQAEKLYAAAIELAGLSGEEIVYDLYCGTGTIGLFCAHASKHVYGIEVVKNAVENARANARRNDVKNIDFVVGDVGESLHGKFGPVEAPKPDVVIVDPPRAGLNPDVPEKIAELGGQKIVYVSCNPSTQTRDIKEFQKLGYRLEVAQPVDMFPHTYHIENVALLVKF